MTGLDRFTKLNEVVLDKNGLTDDDMESLPTLRGVETLSLNKNQISFESRFTAALRDFNSGLTHCPL